MIRACTGLILALYMLTNPGIVQPTYAQESTSFDVFFNSNIRDGKPGLFFVDARTGLSSIVVTNGLRHTLIGKAVLFQEADTNAIKIAYPDGRIEPFGAIDLGGADWTVNWIVSPDHR